MTLHDRVQAAFERASKSLDRCDWAEFHALNAALRAEENRLLADALTEPHDHTGIPPWSAVSRLP